ncbi:spinster family MFS transporter [Nitrospirillum viridazoti]|uniref:MFS transporter n=1 Tax=Nitrospirillum viridazoti CBAmc TaxID=1441467 RepID=A0A248K0K8_9PROT|nr:MFS transporter [Nitrospirillum amazonense]ASG24271.1 MFS transporter [Nitrospirillum amazonense CBAmc]
MSESTMTETAVPPPSPVLAPTQARPRYRVLVMAALFVVYTLNFVDRQILSILALPIKTELGLTDTQLGWLGGPAFALFYTFLAIPIARLADRMSRVRIMAVSLALWSGFTALTGQVGLFWQLFLCRMGVGVGEAGGVAPAYSLISDYFPKHQRARALAVYSFGIPFGSALGILLGGYIATAVNWRLAFTVCGIAGLIMTPIFLICVREPMRGAFDAVKNAGAPVPLRAVLSILGTKPSFWLLSAGAASCSVLGYGLAFWMPAFLARMHGMALKDVSLLLGVGSLVAGTLGIWAGGALADRLGSARKAAYPLVPAVAFLVAVPLYALGFLAKELWLGGALCTLPLALGLAWLGPVIAAVQHVVPPAMRATASAIFLFINNLVGIGFGIFFFGRLSDLLAPRYGTEALRYSMLIGLGFYLLSALFFILSSRRLERDWER